MSVSFQSYQAPDVVTPNSLFNLGDAQHQVLQNQQLGLTNQTTQNALNDAQTVRDNAVAVSQNDPTATATSLAADGTRTQAILDGMKTQDANTRARVAWGMGQAGQAAQSVLNLPPDQQQGAWTALRNQSIANGGNPSDLPEQVPDTASLIAFRKNAIPAAALLTHQEVRQTGSPYDSVDSPQTVPVPGGGAQPPAAGATGPQAGNGGPTPSGAYSQALALRESNPGGKAPNYQATNGAGYLGAYQFGAGRLEDLHVYQPAQGENVENNTYDGTFDIPGHPEVKTAADFLASPAAQDVVQNMSVHDIHNAILNTPGAQNYSEASLQAAAHIGGVAGMRNYVRTANTATPYDRADSNGTRISDYVRDFARFGNISQDPTLPVGSGNQTPAGGTATASASSAPGAAAPASSNGGAAPTYANTGTTPPPGMPAAAGSGTATASAPPAAPGFQNLLADLNSGQPGGSMASAPGTQTASLTGTIGLGATATDATSAPVAATPPLPTSGAGPAGPPPAAAGASASAAGPNRGGPAGPALAQAQANPPTMLPVSGGAPAGEPRIPVQNQLVGLGGGGAPSGPSAPNALLNVGGPQSTLGGTAGTPAPQNPLANLTPSSSATAGSQPSAAPGTSAPGGFQIPPGTHMMYDGRTGVPTGLAYDGSNLPYKPPEHTVQDGVDVIRNPYTQQVIGTQRLFDNRREPSVTLPNGQVAELNPDTGQPLALIGSPTYKADFEQYQQDQKESREDNDNFNELQATQLRLNDQRNLIVSGLQTGAAGETRAELSNYLETLFPNGGGQKAERILGLPPAAAVQELLKTSIQASGQQEKESGARGGYFLTQMYLKANAGPNMQPIANTDVNALQLVSSVASQDYMAQKNAFLNDSGNRFLNSSGAQRYQNSNVFDQQWQAQRNPQVALAATYALAGKPFSVWSQGLSPAEMQRAVTYVGQADPNASIFMQPTPQNPTGRYLAPNPAATQQQPMQAPRQAATSAPAASVPTSGGIPVGSTASGPGGAKLRWDGASWNRLQ